MSTVPKPDDAAPPPAATHRHPSFREALRVWAYIGINSFGGPAGQIAVMHRVLVDEKKWISEHRFLHALNFCMLLPGPEATQLATYVGWLLHRTMGGLAAGILFVLPGFVAMLGLSIVYAVYHETTWLSALFFGLKPAVLAIVVHAVLRIGSRALKNNVMWALAATAFVAIYFFNVPFPIIVLGAIVIGLMGGRWWPGQFHLLASHAGEVAGASGGGGGVIEASLGEGMLEHMRPTVWRSVRTIVIWVTLWMLPLVVIGLWSGRESVFMHQGMFFSKAAMVTFGGAYAVLAYVAQQAVEVYGWLQPGEMLDGLGMAETTPGPLIMVVQFVGFMGAYRDADVSGEMNPIVAGALASVLVTWVTFVPCFLWIFLGAPYMEAQRANKVFNAALSAITAAVVGVIMNLAVWFGLHTLFDEVHEQRVWGMRVLVPEWRTVDVAAVAIALIAAVLMFRFRLGMMLTLGICAALGAGYSLMWGA